jgi:hypothetical protein
MAIDGLSVLLDARSDNPRCGGQKARRPRRAAARPFGDDVDRSEDREQQDQPRDPRSRAGIYPDGWGPIDLG